MALTKKEKADVEELRQRLETVAALRWTDPVEPDVPIPTHNGLSTGFMYSGAGHDSPRVEVACSSSVFHAIGRNDSTTSQRAMRLFSTRLLALKAMRHEAEKAFAHRLARIDRQIAAEKAVQP